MVVANWGRRRRMGRNEALQDESDRTSGRSLRWALGFVLTGGGLVLAGLGLRSLNSASDISVEAGVLGTSVGVLLAASGVLVGQWVATRGRTDHGLGGIVLTGMAVIFGWVAFFGQASGFSVSGGVGGFTASSGGGVTAARIALRIASVLTGLASLWGWRQVLCRHG